MRWQSLALVWLASCAPLVGEEGRPCPCGKGYVCCDELNLCVKEGAVCKPPFATTPTLDALGPGAVLDLGALQCPTPEGEAAGACATAAEDGALRYDAQRHKLLFFGGGGTSLDAVLELDPATLAWSALYPPTPCAQQTRANLDGGTWRAGPAGPYPRPLAVAVKDMLVPMPGALVLLRRDGLFAPQCTGGAQDLGDDGHVAHYGFDAGTWTFSATTLGDAWPDAAAAFESFEYDPPSKRIVGVGVGGLLVYDPALKQRVRPIADLGALGLSGELVFFPPTGHHYYFGTNGKAWRLAPARSDWSASTLVALDAGTPMQESGWAYDSVHQTIGGGITGGKFRTLDPDGGTIRVTAFPGPPEAHRHTLAFDPVNGVYFFLAGSPAHAWAYRP